MQYVNYVHVSPTEFVPEELYYDFHNEIEEKISNKFFEYKVWSHMEYYQKEVKEKIVEEISYLVNNKKIELV